MALREYHCPRCSVTFERIVRDAGDEHKVACPECGERRVRRLISRFAAARASNNAQKAEGCACGGSCACRRP